MIEDINHSEKMFLFLLQFTERFHSQYYYCNVNLGFIKYF